MSAFLLAMGTEHFNLQLLLLQEPGQFLLKLQILMAMAKLTLLLLTAITTLSAPSTPSVFLQVMAMELLNPQPTLPQAPRRIPSPLQTSMATPSQTLQPPTKAAITLAFF